MHLRLIKGLSYDGVVRASAAHPDVFVDDPEKTPGSSTWTSPTCPP